jgi:hypothetical protein
VLADAASLADAVILTGKLPSISFDQASFERIRDTGGVPW